MSKKKPRPYVTERTKMWRTQELSPNLLKELDTIEEFGCQILHITPDDVCPGFSYSIGVYDTCGKPELITVGLTSDTAHYALNEAVALMQDGVDLTIGRYRDIVGDVEVEFRPVSPNWVHHVMLRVDGYYEHADVPVLQLIYPDLENRFQDEPEFNESFRQPILSGDAEHGLTEHDLWAAYDDKSSISRWRFPDGPHTRVFLSKTVQSKEETVTYVSHDSNGDWQFLGDKMADGGGPVISCFHHPIDDDRTLEELHDLPLNWYAIRDKPGTPWQRFERPQEEPEEDTSSDNPPSAPLLN